MAEQRFRVAQWATGHTGRHALRKIIEHPRYDLVGVYTYSADKAGRDAGEIAGTAATGVLATRDVAEIIAARPDCVLYMPLLDHDSVDELCLLLGSGINIVTTVATLHHPRSLDPGVRARLEAACAAGGTSLYDTGPGPGFITEVIPLTVTLMERELNRLTIVQYADVSARQSPRFLPRIFGHPPEEEGLAEDIIATTRAGDSLRSAADGLGVPLDDVLITAVPAVATAAVEVAGTTIEAGTVGAWRVDVDGIRAGRPYLTFQRNMYVTRDLDPAWELHDTGWRVMVDGDAPMYLDIRFPPPEVYNPISAGYNAHLPVNSVKAVCEAPPGLLTTDRLNLVPVFG